MYAEILVNEQKPFHYSREQRFSMEQILNSGTMGIVGAVGVVVVVALVVGFVVMRAGIKVAGPDEALIISGKTQKGAALADAEAKAEQA